VSSPSSEIQVVEIVRLVVERVEFAVENPIEAFVGGPDAVRGLLVERVRGVDDALVVVLAVGSAQ